MQKRFSIFIAIFGLLVFCIWLAAAKKVLSHDIATEGNLIAVTLHIRSLLPPDENDIHDISAEGLATATRAPVQFERLSWQGPIWNQTCLLPCTTLNAIPSQTVVIHGHEVTLPEINPRSFDLPKAPQPLQTPVQKAEANIPTAVLAFLAIIVLTIIYIRKMRSLRSPDFRLRNLPATQESLELIPELLSRKGITQKTHPEFFQELDSLRFAPEPPSQDAIRDIIQKAQAL